MNASPLNTGACQRLKCGLALQMKRLKKLGPNADCLARMFIWDSHPLKKLNVLFPTMINPEELNAIKAFVVAVAPPPQGTKTAEERCQILIAKANERGAILDDSLWAAAFFWGNQGYFDHAFAKALWGDAIIEDGWPAFEYYLAQVVLIDGMYQRLDFIEQSLNATSQENE